MPQQLRDFIGFIYDDETGRRRAEPDAAAMIPMNQSQVYAPIPAVYATLI